METDEESDPYQTDEDEEYCPSSNSNTDEDETNNGNISSSSHLSGDAHVTPAKTKIKQKHQSEWKINKLKRLRTEGKEYVSRNKVHPSKSLQPYQHACRYKCNMNINEEQRKELFRTYYKLPSYDHQTAFLSSCIRKVNVNRKKMNSNIERKFSTNIFLLNKRVCKQFFLKTFHISNKRFSSVCAKTNLLNVAEPDKRGKGQTHRRMRNDQRTFAIKHIKAFPRYQSHYSRKVNLETKYLSCDLNIKIMYNLYKATCEEENQVPVKQSYYRHIFNSEFNLRFHRPHSDTCSRCDSYQNIIKHSTDEPKIAESKLQLAVHQRRVEKAVTVKKNDIEKYKLTNDTVVVCFDLQQSLPTPLLTTSKVFYLRQLWTYNFCIYDLIKNEAHNNMYVWSEDVASKGSQEIGSCLIEFIKSLPLNIKRMVAYSDSCGGQNKNKNISKLFMFLVKATQLEEIHHKFLEPGHTYMECDRSFGLREKCKRKFPQVFVPQDWINVIRSASKRFRVHDMNKEYFYSFAHLNATIGDPKKDTENRKLNFRNISQFKYTKCSETYSFQFKLTIDEDFPFLTCQCSFFGKGRPPSDLQKIFCSMLNEDAVNISVEKWKNLQTLLEYIPPRYHNFYKDLKHGGKKTTTQKKKKENQTSKTTASTSKNTQNDAEFNDTDPEFDNEADDTPILNSDSDSDE